MTMIRLKTAVLNAASLKIGAVLGGASQTDANDLYDFGLNLGMAFQLQDDLLDTFGDQRTIGKILGTDIVDNKKTFLMIKALEKGSSEQRKILTDWLTKKEFEREEKVAAVTGIYKQLKIKEITNNRVREFYELSLENLASLNKPEERKVELANFASFLMNRDK